MTASTAVGRGAGGNLKVWDEESGQLHGELEGFGAFCSVEALASFLSADGQQPRLVAGSDRGHVRVYDPEAGSVLHYLEGHTSSVSDLACTASSSVAPHHPRLVSACYGGTAQLYDGETGELVTELRDHDRGVTSVAVWKEHTGGHDRIATAGCGGRVRVWDGEALTLLHDLECGSAICAVQRLLPFESAEGPTRLLEAMAASFGLQVWDPEEGRRLHHGINRGCPLDDYHLFESAERRHLLAMVGSRTRHPRDLGDREPFLDVWDLGEAPGRAGYVKPAHHLG
jgi:WD40 repeat protein